MDIVNPHCIATDRFAESRMPADKKDRYKTRLNWLKPKLLSFVQAILNPLVEQKEQVVHVAVAIAYFPIELIFGNGWLTMLYNRCIMVAINQRLVALNSNFLLKCPRTTCSILRLIPEYLQAISKKAFGPISLLDSGLNPWAYTSMPPV